jgi:hypothetical protein
LPDAAGGRQLRLAFSGPVVTSLDRIMVATLSIERAAAFDPVVLFNMLSAHLLDVAIAMIPIAFMMTLAAMAAPLMLGGWLFNVESLAPKFSKLNPISGFGNMFSINSLVELGKAVLKTLLVGTVAWLAIRGQMDAVWGWAWNRSRPPAPFGASAVDQLHHHRVGADPDRRAGRPLPDLELRPQAAHDAPRGQAGAQGIRRRSADQGQDPRRCSAPWPAAA